MTNINPPRKIRAAIYVTTAVLAPVVAYLNARGVIGELEVGLWSAEVAVVSLLAGLNTGATIETKPEERGAVHVGWVGVLCLLGIVLILLAVTGHLHF